MTVRIDYSFCMASHIGSERGFADESLEENRSLLVSALESLKSREEAGEAGFLHLLRAGDVKQFLDFVEETSSDTEDIAVFGAGGGVLGARALHGAWSHPMALEGKRVPRAQFFDSVDPDAVSAIRNGAGSPASTQYHVIGDVRGGEAIAAVCSVIRQLLRKEHLSPGNHLVVYADPGCGLLLDFARREGARVFQLPRGVHGPWNILTAAALLTSAFLEFDFPHFLEGARQMSLRCRGADPSSNPASVLAHLWSAGRAVMQPGAAALSGLAQWLHALQDELPEAAREVLPMFVYVDHPRVDYRIEGKEGATLNRAVENRQRAAAAALARSGRPSVALTIDRVREGDVGALVYLLLFASALARELRRDALVLPQEPESFVAAAPGSKRYTV